jgi:hypothetical protein
LADKAYDTEIIKQTITEETTALPQIPVKTIQKSGTYRSKCRAIFRPQVYRFRNQVEGVNSVEKRKFSGINNSRSTNLQIKETKMKNVFYNIYRSIQICTKIGISTESKKKQLKVILLSKYLYITLNKIINYTISNILLYIFNILLFLVCR